MKTDSRDSKKSTKANLQASSYLKQERYNGEPTDRHLVKLAKRDITLKIHYDNPLEMAGDIMGRMCGGITEPELDVAINAAAKELAEEVGLYDFLEPDMFGPGDREMINYAKKSLEAYEYHDDPLADAKKGLRILYDQADESEIDEALRIAKKESEFQQKVSRYYKGLDKKDQDKLRLADQ